MSKYTKKTNLFDSEEGAQIKKTLQDMEADSAYNTVATYTANSTAYPDNVLPFVDKHMNYLKSHPAVNPRDYVLNLQLMTKLNKH